jgi:hypothetical protein
MPISILGDGSITGITSGGLPDGIVTNDDLATGIASSKLSGALPALDGSSLTGVGVDGIVSTANATAITIDSSENVGIGTPTPARRLHISDTTSGATTGIRLTGANNGSQVIEFADTDDTNVGYIQYDHGSNQLTLRVNDGQRLYIDSSGNMGLGVVPETDWDSSYRVLQLHSGGAIHSGGNGMTMSGNAKFDGNDWKYINSSYASKNSHADGSQYFHVAPSGTAGSNISFTTSMMIHNNSRISMGSNMSSGEAQLLVSNTDNITTANFENTISSGFNNSVSKFACSQDTSNQSYILIQGRNGGGARMKCWDSGDFDNTNNSYGGMSDERIKQDISDASSQWDDIKALRVRKFKLKRAVNKDGVENTPLHLGVIAQELEASNMSGLVSNSRPEKEDALLHPDFGTWDGLDGEFTPGDKVKSVKYSILYMKSIKALQEAMARIESLESRIETLENA